ncbi:MotA/TolQ/ExbB proton channel family protein [bacterium]|nr:MotA/TolQ/ExbB proton channel family protein [bacterium]
MRNRNANRYGLLLAGMLAVFATVTSLSAQETPPPDGLETAAVKKGIPREPIEVLYALGAFMYPLGLCSIIVVWFSIERVVVLRRGRVIPRPFVKRFFEHVEQGKVDAKGAIKLCEDNGSPIAHVFIHGLKKWGKPSVEVEQAIIDGGERQLNLLRKHLRVLNGVSTVAPLLGLLGTVVGMIDSFNTLALTQGNKNEELAAGIGLALLTTAVGLMIAIPSLIMYMYLAGRVDALVNEMDGYGQDLIDLVSAEGLAEIARTGRNPAAAPAPKKAS